MPSLNVSLSEWEEIVKTFPLCHPERNEVEPRDLRISERFHVKLVRRSFDSLRSLRMTDLID